MFRITSNSHLTFDNPINLSQVPQEPLSLAFPASLQETRKSELYIIPMLAAFVIASSAYFWAKWIHHANLDKTFHMVQLLASIWLLILTVRRSLSPTQTTFHHIFFANFGCALLLPCTLYVENDIDRITRIAVGASVVFELFLSKYMVRQYQKRNSDLVPDQTPLNAAIISIVGCVALEFIDTLYASAWLEANSATLLILAAAIFAYRGLEWVSVYGISLPYTFLGYPDSSALAPGLLASPEGGRATRICLLSFFCISTFTRNCIYQDPIAVVAYPFLLASCKLLVAIAAYAILVPDEPSKNPTWKQIIKSMSSSANRIERDSFFVGRVEFDGSPVLLHKDLLSEHAHFLGDSGSGKTARGILPLISQAIGRMPFSVIVIDMKADTNEIASETHAANQDLAKRTGSPLSFQTFDLSHNAMTYGFNPFLTTGWNHLSIQEKAETIACACGLDYGQNYGASFFGSANVAPIKVCLTNNPNISSFRELYVDIAKLLRSKDASLLTSTRAAASHVEEVMNRFGRIDALNIGPNGRYSRAQVDSCIDLGSFFVEQKLAYLSLPSTVSSMTSAGVGRMVVYLLMMAARHNKRNHQVVVVIDEFQRLAVQNFESTLQLARSMGVSLVLANQSLQDLRSGGSQLLNSVEANCHFRQWFSLSSAEDIARLEKSAGTRTEIERTMTKTHNSNSVSSRQIERVRLDAKHINAVSDDPDLCIVRIANDQKGYAKYGALPIVVRTSFHISEEEYKLRKSFEIPIDATRMIKNTETNLRAVEPRSRSKDQRDLFDDPSQSDGNDQSTSEWDPNSPEGGF